MFAVKGWSVDAASLRPQTEVYKPPKSQDDEGQKRSKKRKRAHEAKQDPNVRPDDVGRLWEQHVEGGELSRSQEKRQRKKQKLEKEKEAKMVNKHKIEKWEDIKLGTRAQKLGLVKKTKKGKKRVVEEAQDGVEESKLSDSDERPDASNGPQLTQKNITMELPSLPQTSKLTPMQSAMRQKLVSARFRHLNQTLYTEPSSKAQELFDQNPEMFDDYHAGFRQQVSVWPENPLDKFIIAIRQRGKIKPPPNVKPKKRKVNAKAKAPPKDMGIALPRTNGTSVLVDLGCGDARLAHTLTVSGDTKALNLKLYSYDLHSTSPLVTKADISNVPLKNESVDVAILCLALMGTNWISFIEEAHRILRWKGELWVAEIKSRFSRTNQPNKPVEHSVGGKRKQAALSKVREAKQKEDEELDEQEVLQTEVDGAVMKKEETDVSAFVQVLKRRGFILKPPGEKSVDLRNKMFVKMEFVKALTPVKGKPDVVDAKGGHNSKTKFFSEGDEDVDTDDETKVLKPCLYKVR